MLLVAHAWLVLTASLLLALAVVVLAQTTVRLGRSAVARLLPSDDLLGAGAAVPV